jgi:hypothetical protein
MHRKPSEWRRHPAPRRPELLHGREAADLDVLPRFSLGGGAF